MRLSVALVLLLTGCTPAEPEEPEAEFHYADVERLADVVEPTSGTEHPGTPDPIPVPTPSPRRPESPARPLPIGPRQWWSDTTRPGVEIYGERFSDGVHVERWRRYGQPEEFEGYPPSAWQPAPAVCFT